MFYPVLVLIEGFPHNLLTNQAIIQQLQDKKLLIGDDIAPLSILSPEDLEIVAGYSDMTLVDALRRWLSSGTAFGTEALGHYLAPQLDGKGNDWIRDQIHSAYLESTQFVFGSP